MSAKQDYVKLMDAIDKLVEQEIPVFKNLVPYRKSQQLSANIKACCKAKNSTNGYGVMSKKNPKYEKEIAQSEYLEFLAATRIRKQLQVCDENELKSYVNHLKSKLEQGLAEPDLKKRFNLYDYICVGCLHCHVDNQEIMSEIAKIRERANEIIREIPTM